MYANIKQIYVIHVHKVHVDDIYTREAVYEIKECSRKHALSQCERAQHEVGIRGSTRPIRSEGAEDADDHANATSAACSWKPCERLDVAHWVAECGTDRISDRPPRQMSVVPLPRRSWFDGRCPTGSEETSKAVASSCHKQEAAACRRRRRMMAERLSLVDEEQCPPY